MAKIVGDQQQTRSRHGGSFGQMREMPPSRDLHGNAVDAFRQRETVEEPASEVTYPLRTPGGGDTGDWLKAITPYAFPVFYRLVLFLFFLGTENLRPFVRVIHSDEMWLYRNPIPDTPCLEELVGWKFKKLLDPLPTIAYPFIAILIVVFVTSRSDDGKQAAYAYTLSVPITGIVVNIIKVFAGRPRPDFLARCYGMDYYLQYYDVSRECFRDDIYLYDGRKSFPSGHTALAASCFGFLILYLSGIFKTFHENSKYRLSSVLVMVPLMMMVVIVGLSRTCDYKHHWQDVLVGGLIGFSITYLCYRVYFPSLTHERSDISLQRLNNISKENMDDALSVEQVYRRKVRFTKSFEEGLEPQEMDPNNPGSPHRPYLPNNPSFH